MPNARRTGQQYVLKYAVLALISLLFVAVGCAMDSPADILRGLQKIVAEPAVLITDYIEVGGVGASLVNAGALMLLSTALLYALGVDISGLSVASVFLMGGFALFGKNFANVWPIPLGTLLYAKLRREPYAKHVHTALLSTSIAPLVTEVLFVADIPAALRLPLALLLGASIGFLIPPLAANMVKLHRGMTLYNVGFSVGILGTIYMSIFKSYGYAAYSRLIWSTDAHRELGIFLAALFLGMIALSLLIDRRALKTLPSICRREGTLGTCFCESEGFAAALANMGINGILASAYVLAVGGPFNGPTVGGILTVSGFGAFGKHWKNMLPIFAGTLIGGFTKTWNLNDPPMLIAALFGTSLAPIAGNYGWFWGIVAGFANSSVVLNSGFLHGGMNLYNTGFAAGFVAMVMVPLLDALRVGRAEPATEKAAARPLKVPRAFKGLRRARRNPPSLDVE